MVSYGFQPTYEELKLKSAHRRERQEYTRFQPTYEELKRKKSASRF